MTKKKHLLEFVPSICKADDKGGEPAYNGHVILRMPNYEERLNLYKASESPEGENPLEALLRFARLVPTFVEKVAITRAEDGFAFKTYEDLEFDSDMAVVISEIGAKLTGKYAVGKTSTPS